MERIKLKTEQEGLLESMGSVVETNDKRYFFMPYWFEKTAIEGEYIIHMLDEAMPSELKDIVDSRRQPYLK